MPSIDSRLRLNEKQLEVLSEQGIRSDDVYRISGDLLHHTACRIDGYSNGHFVFFIEGTMSEHLIFLKYLFGDSYSAVIPSRFRGLTIYASPTGKFVKPENKVTIEVVLVSAPIDYI
jgi:hypothetical protein